MTAYEAMPNGETVQSSQEHIGTVQVNNDTDSGGSGYINNTRHLETEQKQANEAQQIQSEQEYKELQEKLGVNFDELPREEPSTKNEKVPPNNLPTKEQLENLARLKAQHDYLQKFNTEEGKKFRTQFREYMGVDPIEAFQTINETRQQVQQMQQWRAAQEKQNAVATLQQEWGAEFENTWVAVREEFNKLSPDLKAKLDNLEGARLLAAKVRQDGRVATSSGVPQFQRSGFTSPTSNIRNTGSPSGYIKTSDFFNDKVSEAEYLQALHAGRVIRDM